MRIAFLLETCFQGLHGGSPRAQLVVGRETPVQHSLTLRRSLIRMIATIEATLQHTTEHTREQTVSGFSKPEGVSSLSKVLLAARTSSMATRPLHRVARLSYPPRDSIGGFVTSEKLSRAIPSSESAPGRLHDWTPDTTVPHRQAAEHRDETGGAGEGAVVEVVAGAADGDFDNRSASDDGSTLPPPYSSHFAEARFVRSRNFPSGCIMNAIVQSARPPRYAIADRGAQGPRVRRHRVQRNNLRPTNLSITMPFDTSLARSDTPSSVAVLHAAVGPDGMRPTKDPVVGFRTFGDSRERDGGMQTASSVE